MGQASGTASNYSDKVVEDVQNNYPNVSDDAKCQASPWQLILIFLVAVVRGSINETALQDTLHNIEGF